MTRQKARQRSLADGEKARDGVEGRARRGSHLESIEPRGVQWRWRTSDSDDDNEVEWLAGPSAVLRSSSRADGRVGEEGEDAGEGSETMGAAARGGHAAELPVLFCGVLAIGCGEGGAASRCPSARLPERSNSWIACDTIACTLRTLRTWKPQPRICFSRLRHLSAQTAYPERAIVPGRLLESLLWRPRSTLISSLESGHFSLLSLLIGSWRRLLRHSTESSAMQFAMQQRQPPGTLAVWLHQRQPLCSPPRRDRHAVWGQLPDSSNSCAQSADCASSPAVADFERASVVLRAILDTPPPSRNNAPLVRVLYRPQLSLARCMLQLFVRVSRWRANCGTASDYGASNSPSGVVLFSVSRSSASQRLAQSSAQTLAIWRRGACARTESASCRVQRLSQDSGHGNSSSGQAIVGCKPASSRDVSWGQKRRPDAPKSRRGIAGSA
ncbi:hypothetical protein BU16DRAFT_565461 [Lophium mytilinum]|uniref:Uncharacterized protein n=1 Tax=Lophium mytilinum TaxID=390894 RepID=A0A6A6QH67_9PEZI|nr:hypothetical protein BU16DRAFT_565461 [Lophium mytilinum]